MKEFENKNFIITGAAGAIAEPLIDKLYKKNANLLLIDIKEKKLAEITSKYNNDRIKFVTSDLSSKTETDKILNDYNRKIFGLIHLAGLFELDKDNPGDEEIWDRAILSSAKNAYFLISSCMSFFHEDLISRIVLISSMAYRRGAFNYIPYSAAKGAIAGMIRAYARKFGPKIRINGLAPGIVDSPMSSGNIKVQGTEKLVQEIALKRFCAPSEVSSVIKFLLSDDSSYITGQIINIDGGTVFS